MGTGYSPSLDLDILDDIPNNIGIIPRATAHIFHSIKEKKEFYQNDVNKYDCKVHLEFLEIYGESINDLLGT